MKRIELKFKVGELNEGFIINTVIWILLYVYGVASIMILIILINSNHNFKKILVIIKEVPNYYYFDARETLLIKKMEITFL